MSDKKMRLPKEGLVQPEERTRSGENITGTDDVEGHGLPVTPPPFMPQRSPGHGGEAVPTDDEIDPPSLR